MPVALRFGGQTWKVKLGKELEKTGKQLLGKCDYTNTTILIDPDQSLDGFKSTLLHEAVHAQAHALDWDAKEKTVIKVEKLIYAMLRDNPTLFRWLLSRKMDCPVCGKPAGTCSCHDSNT